MSTTNLMVKDNVRPIAKIQALVKVDVARDSIVSTADVYVAIEELRRLSRQEKTIETTKRALRAQVEQYMGEHATLLSDEGETIVTWKYNKESEIINKERLMREFPDVYNQVAELREGPRVFKIL